MSEYAVYEGKLVPVDELMHHGVQGQKWGKRNGPPYPLNAEGRADLEKQIAKSEKKSRKAGKAIVRNAVGTAASGYATNAVATTLSSPFLSAKAAASIGKIVGSQVSKAAVAGGASSFESAFAGGYAGTQAAIYGAQILAEYGPLAVTGLTGLTIAGTGLTAVAIGRKFYQSYKNKKLNDIKKEDDAAVRRALEKSWSSANQSEQEKSNTKSIKEKPSDDVYDKAKMGDKKSQKIVLEYHKQVLDEQAAEVKADIERYKKDLATEHRRKAKQEIQFLLNSREEELKAIEDKRKEISSSESNKKASKDSTIKRWDNIPKNVSFNDYCKKYLRTDPIKTREADEELYALLKMEYDEFKRYKNN